jgi:hypothetical protein
MAGEDINKLRFDPVDPGLDDVPDDAEVIDAADDVPAPLRAWVDRIFPCSCPYGYSGRSRHAPDCANATAHWVVEELIGDGYIRTEALA